MSTALHRWRTQGAVSLHVALLLAMLAVVGMVSVVSGSTPVTLAEVARSMGLLLSGAADSHYTMVDRIVVDLRLPRMVLAIVVGGGLAVVGALLQTATRNDLSDPYLFGLSSGSAAGAVAVITLTGEVLGLWTLPLAAFVGGMASVGVVLLLLRRYRSHTPERMILAGLSVSFLFTALTYYFTFLGDQRAAQSVLFWTMGGLGSARWDNLFVPLAGLLALAVFCWRKHSALDAMLGGENTAHSLGIDPQRLRIQAFVVCAFATACFVAVSGVIGFVGLMVPHLARAAAGALHRGMLVLAVLMGALLLLLSDVMCRTVLAPQELPVGIITASVGALFVMYTLLNQPDAA
ncbi:iron ABC transporter permease [Rhodoferax sp.]|uniref:FecCD family ABC transporter permease n=1 Tax=Rhodoferax sp. TaxID=50421 RepID=UPI0025EF4F13|nr:iron ABC transporter permease [Rhodoferax sp.]